MRNSSISLFNITIDIFCDVIDNYGDAGVCLHLARSLAIEQGYKVTLYCNNLNVLNQITNKEDKDNLNLQLYEWTDHQTKTYHASDVVISAFSCHLNQDILKEIHKQNSLVINLEYLSAEDWIEDCHLRQSFADNLQRCYYFFPGFTSKTGGLNVDRDFKRQCALELIQLKNKIKECKNSELTLSLFSYKNQALAYIIESIQQHETNIQSSNNIRSLYKFLVFENLPWNNLKEILEQRFSKQLLVQIPTIQDKSNLTKQAESYEYGFCNFIKQTMLEHKQYDQILISSDFNFVRGEDSIVRAMHTGKPFLWQIYYQEEQAHIKKLESFLDRFAYIQKQIQQEISTNISNQAVQQRQVSLTETLEDLEDLNATLNYRKIEQDRLENSLSYLRQSFLAYNDNDTYHFPKDFNLVKYIHITQDLYYNFALYLLKQDSLTDSLSSFIEEQILK